MLREKVTHILWDYGLKWVAYIMHTTAGSVVSLHYHASLEEVTGETHDISEYLDFSFYDWCWYNDNSVVEETKFGKMDEHISSRW